MDPSVALQAIFLNNKGIEFVRSKKFADATKEFSKGLTLVKQELATCAEEHDNSDMEVEDAEEEDNFYFASPQDVTTKKGEPFMFRSPIVVPSYPTELQESVSSRCYIKLSLVLLYNLALTYHLSALEEPSHKKLLKALSLYELAYTVQMTEDMNVSVLQTMAIVNNLGQIHALLGAEEKAVQCFGHLLSTIMFVNDCGEQDHIQEMDGFVSNVMQLIIRENDSTAPAA